MKTCFTLGACALASILLVACGGGGGGSPRTAGVSSKASIPITNITPQNNFSFEINDVKSAKAQMDFTDRKNKSGDVIDMKTNTLLKQITGGFAGCDTGPSCNGANNDKSGPDGLNVIPGTNFIYVGDVNSVKVIDSNTLTVVNTIVVSASGLRADEGCY